MLGRFIYATDDLVILEKKDTSTPVCTTPADKVLRHAPANLTLAL